MRTTLTFGLLVAIAATAQAQDLGRGITDADLVAVGRQVGKKKHDDQVDLHRIQLMRDVFGGGGHQAVTVLDWPKLSVHQRPTPRQSRLYCLKSAQGTAENLGLPAADGPYYKMVGWAGSNPLIGAEPQQDPIVRFAEVIARSKNGASAVTTAAELQQLAVHGAAAVRAEAARLLTERGDLRGVLAAVHWSQLVARAAGETEDIPYKIALAELCAEQRLEGLVDTLAVSLGPVQDPEYARCVGRIARHLLGEDATAVLEARLQHLREPKDRAVVLLAIGASNTDAALAFLLRLDGVMGRDAAVEAALAEHRSPQAKEAVARRRK